MARILVVEDNPTNLQLMVYLLQAYGHSTLQAMDGEAGLAAAHGERPDLVLCDVDLPRLDGIQVARELRLDPALRSIPLIAVTALAMVGDRERLLQAGFDGYLSKPIQPQEFVGQIEQFLPAELRACAKPAPASITAEEPTVAAPPSAPRARVLVVDDRPMNLELARCILEPQGYAAILVQSVSAALEAARREPPDLVLSDLNMPRGGGFDLLAAMKADAMLREVPFAFLSSTSDDEVERRALALGASAFLQRPIRVEALLSEVQRLIEKARATEMKKWNA